MDVKCLVPIRCDVNRCIAGFSRIFYPTIAALTFRDDARALTRGEIALMLALHLAGLAAVWRYLHQPIWLALPALALLLALPALQAYRARRALAVETLAPLFFLYIVLLARVITVWFIRAPLPYQDESTLADARLLVFQVELAIIAALVYTVLVQISRINNRRQETGGSRQFSATCCLPPTSCQLTHTHHASRFTFLALTLALAALAWFAAETLIHRTRGVTATDPYAYVQMAVDLATRGTFLHAFPLFAEIKDLGIKWYPIQHIGYRLFENETGSAATVWPPWGSVWLALMYRVFGEDGLYIATPLAALASLVVVGWFAWEYVRARLLLERALVAAISVTLLATSWEMVDRALVPLVDAQAQLFSTLTILLALVCSRQYALGSRQYAVGSLPPATRHLPPAICLLLTGVALGAAYAIRHTQLLLVIPIVIAVAMTNDRRPTTVATVNGRVNVRALTLIALGAFIVALPDLVYHQQNFGHWLTPESHELKHFALANVLPSAGKIAERFFAGNEFGYLFPFMMYGAYRAWRDDARRFAVLATWLGVLVAFHLFYEALRMRDLLPQFPVVVVLTAYGIVALVRDLRGRLSAVGGLLSAVVVFLALLLFLTRTQFTLLRVAQPARVTFGYVTAAQRAAFDQIAALTPANAVIGSTMNDGAIDLYARRATFRPSEWSADELVRFVEAMQRAQRRVFLLDDGAETSAARRALSARYTLQPIAVLDVPLFSVVDGTPGMLWEIMLMNVDE